MKTLYGANTTVKLPPASLTKMMLLLIAAERLEQGGVTMNDVVTVSKNAASADGSVIWLTSGETMILSELLKSIVIASANDSSVAVAEYLAGSEASFVALMNKRAAALGMNNTHFDNCTGLDSKTHYSTAADLAILLSALAKRDVFTDWCNTRLSYVRDGTDKRTELLNTNKLYDTPGLIFAKTGTTDAAGYCLGLAVKKDTVTLISVVLGAGSEAARVKFSSELLDRGFENFGYTLPQIDAKKLTSVKVIGGVDKNVDVWVKDESGFIISKKGTPPEYHYALVGEVRAPVKRGQKLGKVQAIQDDVLVYESDIIAFSGVEELSFMKSVSLILKEMLRM